MTDLQDLINGVRDNPQSQIHLDILHDELLVNDLWNEDYINSLVVKYKKYNGFRYLAADYYDENDKARAEFIRLHCQFSNHPDFSILTNFSSELLDDENYRRGGKIRDKARELFRNHHKKWLPVFSNDTHVTKFKRLYNGYLEQLHMNWATWVNWSYQYLDKYPITKVEIEGNIYCTVKDEEDIKWYIQHITIASKTYSYPHDMTKVNINDWDSDDLMKDALSKRYPNIKFNFSLPQGRIEMTNDGDISRENVNAENNFDTFRSLPVRYRN